VCNILLRDTYWPRRFIIRVRITTDVDLISTNCIRDGWHFVGMKCSVAMSGHTPYAIYIYDYRLCSTAGQGVRWEGGCCLSMCKHRYVLMSVPTKQYNINDVCAHLARTQPLSYSIVGVSFFQSQIFERRLVGTWAVVERE